MPVYGLRLGEGCRVSHFLSTHRRARPRYLRCMYDVHGVCTPSRCVSTLIHGWLGSRGQPRLATNFLTRSWFAAADGWTRLPRKVTRWPPGNVGSRTLADAYGRLRTLIPGAWLLLLPRVTVSNRTSVWLGLNMLKIKYDINQQSLKTVDLHFVKS